MNINILKDAVESSHSGKKNFPQIVGMLLDAKIEAYHVDLVRGENRYYDAEGDSAVIALPHKAPQAAEKFSPEGVIAAVRKSQQGLHTYHQFINEITSAGCIYYIAYLAGKQVMYLGRKGEFHIEHFPNK